MEREREDDPYDAISYGDFSTYFRHKKQKLQLQQEEINYKVAKPEWITESVKANRLLSWHKFSTLRVPNSLSKFESRPSTEGSPDPSEPLVLTRRQEDKLETQPDQRLDHVKPKATTESPVVAPTNSHTMAQLDMYGNDGQSEEPPTDNLMENVAHDGDSPLADETFTFDELNLDELELQLTPPSTEQVSNTIRTSPHLQDADGEVSPLKVSTTDSSASILAGLRSNVLPDNAMDRVQGEDDIVDSAQPTATPCTLDNRHPTLIELSVPWNRLNSSIQPGFVEKFYQSSRLHYLSTWKAKLREITAEIQKVRPLVPSNSKRKIIMHIDFDCFFASVATRVRPELQNKPIAVAHGSGGASSNSEIASCNYLAREFGVKNGMHLQKARTLCPEIVVVPYEFQEYEDISIEFYKILLSYADELQAVSVDEALLDITSKCISAWEHSDHPSISGQHPKEGSTQMNPEELAERVRKEIFSATGCHASVGIAPNILLAKLATKRAKPHGQYIWPSAPGSDRTLQELRGPILLPPDLDQALSSTPINSEDGSQPNIPESPAKKLKTFTVKDLPGVGYKTTEDLKERFSVQTLYELQQISREELQGICGMKTGEMLYNSCRGIDETTIASDREKARQSVSAEISWGVRFENQDQVDVFLRDLSKEVSKRLKEIDRKAKSIVIKIMKRKEYVQGQWKHLGHGPVDQFARTGQLPTYTDDPGLIAREARNLLLYFKFDVLDIRGLGIQMLKLNNDVINTVSKSAFTSQDLMNQTTLTSAMFQQKPRSTTTGITSGPPVAVNEKQTTSSSTDTPQLEDVSRHNEGLTMEIDSETFRELPPDIQEELSRQHRLVFVDRNGHEDSQIQGSMHVEHGKAPMQSGHSTVNDRSNTDKSLPPWLRAELAGSSVSMTKEAIASRDESYPTDNGQSGGCGTLPSFSQLDRSVLQALPPEIRAEIEQEYTHIKENNELIRQLAFSDGNNAESRPEGSGRGRNRPRGSTSGRGRGRGKGRGKDQSIADGIGASSDGHGDTHVNEGRQSSGRKEDVEHEPGQVPELDEEFLAALPPDIRGEVEAAHRLEVMKSRQRQAELATKNRQTTNLCPGPRARDQIRLAGSPLPERPTLMGLREIDEVRELLAEWVQSTLIQEEGTTDSMEHTASHPISQPVVYDEGPNPEDVESFSTFISKVIFMERDLERAQVLLRYLRRKVEENERQAIPFGSNPEHIRTQMSWQEAWTKIVGVAQRIVSELYGGPLVLD
ncbi:deoxycytidyl transferase [Mortierella sp. GBA43]|nr:deoxycytidyl transferase [Mortierella sp. GBA43]